MTALITGASLRIGRQVALALASRGTNIVLHYNRSRKAATELQTKIEAMGAQAFPVACDFGEKSGSLEKRISSFVKKVHREVPRVDILINNASVFYPTPVGKIREKQWDEMLGVNLKAPFFLSQEIGMRMKRHGAGKIINLVDWTIRRPGTRYLPYVISKAGLHLVTEILAKELAPQVQVNSIAPGPILPSRGMTNKEKRAVAERTLLKRFGDPSDVWAAVDFLIRGTDYVTGVLIPVEGGSLIA